MPIMSASYAMPTRITFGVDSLQMLPSLASIEAAKTIKLVIGGKSLKESGHLSTILGLLAGRDVRITEGVPAEPGVSDLEREVQSLREHPVDCVLGVGGGSVLDLAKAAAFAAPQKVDPRELLKRLPAKLAPSIPFVAVPTTAGTGSEVTPWSVFWEKEEKKKYSLSHPLMFPSDALVDPELTYSMPPRVTANTGMDAFTQACEAYWNKNSNPTSDTLALESVCLILPALPKAVANGQDQSARHDMMLGSLRAGQAFSNTRTTACHSISYPMTLYFGVPHGQAVGITLPEVLLLNASVTEEARTARFLAALHSQSMEEVAEKIRAMMIQSGLKTRLSEIGINREGIETIVKQGFTPGRMENTPYAFTEDTLRKMLKSIL